MTFDALKHLPTIANSPNLQELLSSLALVADAERKQADAQDRETALREQEVTLKAQEVAELQRKNDLEEQRNVELREQSARISRLNAIVENYIQSYKLDHHIPLNESMQTMLAKTDLIFQLFVIIIPEIIKASDTRQTRERLDLLQWYLANPRAGKLPDDQTVVNVNTGTAFHGQGNVNTGDIVGGGKK